MRCAITDAAGALRDLGVELVPGGFDDRAALYRLCPGAAGLFDVTAWDKEQGVDETYRFTGEHRSVYDRTTAETHDVTPDLRGAGSAEGVAGLKPSLHTSAGLASDRVVDTGVLRAPGYRSGARHADRG